MFPVLDPLEHGDREEPLNPLYLAAQTAQDARQQADSIDEQTTAEIGREDRAYWNDWYADDKEVTNQ